jgi:outer membrane murein-binding lipoprotein Lpp
MKRKRAPFARRSVWTLIAIVSVVFVVGGVIIGYQIHQLQSDISGLNHQLALLNQAIQQKQK